MKKLLKKRSYPMSSIVLSHIKEWGAIRIKLAKQNDSFSEKNFLKIFFCMVNTDKGFFRGTLTYHWKAVGNSSFAFVGATPFQPF